MNKRMTLAGFSPRREILGTTRHDLKHVESRGLGKAAQEVVGRYLRAREAGTTDTHIRIVGSTIIIEDIAPLKDGE